MRRISLLLLPLLACAAACSSDEPTQPTPVNRVDIVTLEESTPLAKFVMDLPGASAGYKTLVASEPLWEEVDKGTRLLVDYDAAVADTARTQVPIELNGFHIVLSPPLEPMPHDDIAALPSGEAEIISQWRTGEWINVQLSAAYAGARRAIAVAADESTFEDEVVKCYIFNPGEPVGPNSVGRNAYASFFIGDLGLRPDQKVEILVK